MINRYLNGFKKYTAITIIGYSSLTNFACVKMVPINNFININTELKINEEKVADKEVKKEYKINNINYSVDSLELKIKEITKSELYNTGTKETYDLYVVGTRKEFDSTKTGLTVGLLGILASTITGLIMIANPPIEEKCYDYQTKNYRCADEKQTPKVAYLVLSLGISASIGVGYGISRMDERIYEEDIKKEKKNIKIENIKSLESIEVLHENPAVNIPIQLISDHFLFDKENSIKLNTDNKGIIKTKIKAKKENFSFIKEGLQDIKLIKDLKYLGMENLAKKLIEISDKIEYPLIIKINDEENNIILKGYEIPTSKMEELMK